MLFFILFLLNSNNEYTETYICNLRPLVIQLSPLWFQVDTARKQLIRPGSGKFRWNTSRIVLGQSGSYLAGRRLLVENT